MVIRENTWIPPSGLSQLFGIWFLNPAPPPFFFNQSKGICSLLRCNFRQAYSITVCWWVLREESAWGMLKTKVFREWAILSAFTSQTTLTPPPTCFRACCFLQLYPAIAWDSAALRSPYYSPEPGKIRAVISSWNWYQSFLILAWLSSSRSAWLS